MKKYQTGGTATTTTKKPGKVVKKSKTVSQALGDITLRDVKDAGETALNLSTLGGYGVAKKKVKELMNKKSGGTVKKAQGGTSLGMKSVKAGYDKNPGVTRADIIVAAKKKAQNGFKANPYAKMDKAKVIAKGYKETTDGKFTKPKMKMGGKMAKQAATAIAMKKAGKAPKAMKAGGKMAKCKYGCK